MNLGSFRILLPSFRIFCGVGVLNSAIFNSFHNPVEFGTILDGLQNFGGSLNPPKPPLGTPLFITIIFNRQNYGFAHLKFVLGFSGKS